jgi:hypothetical protein
VKSIVLSMFLVVCSSLALAQSSNGEIESTLSEEMLIRIKSVTDTFEVVDGLPYSVAVGLFEDAENPESSLIELEEMARVYTNFCANRCESAGERWDVYKALLIRRANSYEKTLEIFKPSTLTEAEVHRVVSQYKLAAKP